MSSPKKRAQARPQSKRGGQLAAQTIRNISTAHRERRIEKIGLKGGSLDYAPRDRNSVPHPRNLRVRLHAVKDLPEMATLGPTDARLDIHNAKTRETTMLYLKQKMGAEEDFFVITISDPANGDDIDVTLSIEEADRGSGNLPARTSFISTRLNPTIRSLDIQDQNNRNKKVATIEFSAHWEDDTAVIQRELGEMFYRTAHRLVDEIPLRLSRSPWLHGALAKEHHQIVYNEQIEINERVVSKIDGFTGMQFMSWLKISGDHDRMGRDGWIVERLPIEAIRFAGNKNGKQNRFFVRPYGEKDFENEPRELFTKDEQLGRYISNLYIQLAPFTSEQNPQELKEVDGLSSATLTWKVSLGQLQPVGESFFDASLRRGNEVFLPAGQEKGRNNREGKQNLSKIAQSVSLDKFPEGAVLVVLNAEIVSRRWTKEIAIRAIQAYWLSCMERKKTRAKFKAKQATRIVIFYKYWTRHALFKKRWEAGKFISRVMAGYNDRRRVKKFTRNVQIAQSVVRMHFHRKDFKTIKSATLKIQQNFRSHSIYSAVHKFFMGIKKFQATVRGVQWRYEHGFDKLGRGMFVWRKSITTFQAHVRGAQWRYPKGIRGQAIVFKAEKFSGGRGEFRTQKTCAIRIQTDIARPLLAKRGLYVKLQAQLQPRLTLLNQMQKQHKSKIAIWRRLAKKCTVHSADKMNRIVLIAGGANVKDGISKTIARSFITDDSDIWTRTIVILADANIREIRAVAKSLKVVGVGTVVFKPAERNPELVYELFKSKIQEAKAARTLARGSEQKEAISQLRYIGSTGSSMNGSSALEEKEEPKKKVSSRWNTVRSKMVTGLSVVRAFTESPMREEDITRILFEMQCTPSKESVAHLMRRFGKDGREPTLKDFRDWYRDILAPDEKPDGLHDEQSVKHLMDTIKHEYKKVDVLINNVSEVAAPEANPQAATSKPKKLLASSLMIGRSAKNGKTNGKMDSKTESSRAALAGNVQKPYACFQECIRLLTEAPSPVVVNVCPVEELSAALSPMHSKPGLLALTEFIAKSYANIRCNAVCPVLTPKENGGRKEISAEVASMTRFLVSEGAPFMTGQSFQVQGYKSEETMDAKNRLTRLQSHANGYMVDGMLTHSAISLMVDPTTL